MFPILRKHFLLVRCNNLLNLSKSFNRQPKSSKWFVKSNNLESIADNVTANLSPKCLIKPFIFTVTFSSGCFAAASIWQYEQMRKIALRYMDRYSWSSYGPTSKFTEFRRQMNARWQRQSEGQRVAATIIAINLGVFLLWRIPSLYPFMSKYFLSSPATNGSCLPMFLSTFSHHSFLHLTANMYVLYSFSHSAVSFFGKEQFLAIYGSAGVVSSFSSYVYKVMSGRVAGSLGASGALMAILASICYQFPDTQLQIIFLPFFTFSAGHAIKAVMALDFVGLLAKWKLFDHAAHLGGATFGLLYLTYGREHIWNKREKFFTWYHDIRERKE